MKLYSTFRVTVTELHMLFYLLHDMFIIYVLHSGAQKAINRTN